MDLNPVITHVEHPLATIWLAREADDDASYFYGGTRLIDPATSDVQATHTLMRLMNGESGTKNRLINWAMGDGALDRFKDELPAGFLESRVAGARCIVRPRTTAIAESLADPTHVDNTVTTETVLGKIGEVLNDREPRIKLTPDFGRFAGLADILHRYTPNVLGIRCDHGGCGGKSSYSTTGVLAGMSAVADRSTDRRSVTLIGSAGAMGSGVTEWFQQHRPDDVSACDLVYDTASPQAVPARCTHLVSKDHQFTDQCMHRAGLIIATTVGDELEHSRWQDIPPGTVVLLAHNLALPAGPKGAAMTRKLHQRGVLVIPGQALTLGGALTARVEWYWRQLPTTRDFNKALAHRVVDGVVSHLVRRVVSESDTHGITPYEAMLRVVGEEWRIAEGPTQ